jgi:tetratricopeptide (TPR) repeat protein
METMINRLQLFLGPTMLRVLIAWFALTGFASLILNSVVNQYDWVRPAQSVIVILFLLGVLAIFVSRLSPGDRGRWLAILLPVLIALFLARFIVPQWGGVLVGGSVGWVVAALLLTRSRMPIEYHQAIKHLRKNEYDQAAKVMDAIITAEPDHANHYRFRAEIFRLWGKFKLAVRDYHKMAQLDPRSPVAYNGLAEVYLQTGDYDKAQEAAHKAVDLAPDDWVTYYNLGMIEDRLKDSQSVIADLTKALTLKVPDARHRLLIHLYLTRAYTIMGQTSEAENQLQILKRHTSGLEEWKNILNSDQAVTLRAVIGKDIDLALDLVNDSLTLSDLRKMA